jgi:hypothetical protein
MQRGLNVKVVVSPKTATVTRARRRGQHGTLLLTAITGLTFKLQLFVTNERLGAETVVRNVRIHNCLDNMQQLEHLHRLSLKFNHSCNRFKLLAHQTIRHSYIYNETLLKITIPIFLNTHLSVP